MEAQSRPAASLYGPGPRSRFWRNGQPLGVFNNDSSVLFAQQLSKFSTFFWIALQISWSIHPILKLFSSTFSYALVTTSWTKLVFFIFLVWETFHLSISSYLFCSRLLHWIKNILEYHIIETSCCFQKFNIITCKFLFSTDVIVIYSTTWYIHQIRDLTCIDSA